MEHRDGTREIDLQITCKSYLRVYLVSSSCTAMTDVQVITTRFEFPACLSADTHTDVE